MSLYPLPLRSVCHNNLQQAALVLRPPCPQVSRLLNQAPAATATTHAGPSHLHSNQKHRLTMPLSAPPVARAAQRPAGSGPTWRLEHGQPCPAPAEPRPTACPAQAAPPRCQSLPPCLLLSLSRSLPPPHLPPPRCPLRPRHSRKLGRPVTRQSLRLTWHCWA